MFWDDSDRSQPIDARSLHSIASSLNTQVKDPGHVVTIFRALHSAKVRSDLISASQSKKKLLQSLHAFIRPTTVVAVANQAPQPLFVSPNALAPKKLSVTEEVHKLLAENGPSSQP